MPPPRPARRAAQSPRLSWHRQSCERVQQLHDAEGGIAFEGVVQRVRVTLEGVVSAWYVHGSWRPVDVDRCAYVAGDRRERHAVTDELGIVRVEARHFSR